MRYPNPRGKSGAAGEEGKERLTTDTVAEGIGGGRRE